MQVDVALFAHLSSFQPDGEAGRKSRAFELPEGTTVGALIESLGLPAEPRVLFVNGRHAEDGTVLCEGDRLAIFPPVAGG